MVGDNAYICSETLLTPFSGVEKDDPSKDALNFYLSQMRIRANIWTYDRKMNNSMSITSDASKKSWESMYVHYKTTQLLH